jgi:DNA-binding CsgD family transcriptional regulator
MSRYQSKDQISEEGLIIRLYEAALDEEEPEALWTDVCRFLGGEIFWFLGMDPRRGSIYWHFGYGPDREGKERSKQIYVDFKKSFSTPETNPWLAAATALPEGEFITNEKLIPRNVFEKMDVYNEFIHPYRIEETQGMNLIKKPSFWVSFSCYRSRKRGAFDDEELRRGGVIGEHLRRFAHIRAVLGEAASKRRNAIAALERLQSAVIIVDSKGNTVFRNESANKIIEKNDGLLVQNGRLTAENIEDNVKLGLAIREATKTAVGKGKSTGGELTVQRKSMSRPFTVIVAPLPAHPFTAGVGIGSAVVFVADPEAEVDYSIQMLKKLYDFTESEAKVAMMISTGLGVEYAAKRLAVSKNTVRTHLAHIFDKTGARKQGELIRLLLTGPGIVTPK